MSDEKKPKLRVIWCSRCGTAQVFEWSTVDTFPADYKAALADLEERHAGVGHCGTPDLSMSERVR